MHRPNDASNDRLSVPQWLVSVRDLAEAEMAASYGVCILDWKEPRLGALAPVAQEIWKVAANWAKQRDVPIPLSAALGEGEVARTCSHELPDVFRWAKVGASRTSPNTLPSLWADIRTRLPKSVELVAVAYADAPAADCPEPEVVFQLAAENGFQRVLVDTYTKESGSTLAWMGQRLHEIRRIARDRGLWWALAGSIKLSDVRSLAANTLPDCFAVRGDVCGGGREGTLDPERLRTWAEHLRAQQRGASKGQVTKRQASSETAAPTPKQPSNPV
ncbi:MAG: (5-formylfuran-3-yl)methyl phosphate synthase [Planctomycetota bacterium]